MTGRRLHGKRRSRGRSRPTCAAARQRIGLRSGRSCCDRERPRPWPARRSSYPTPYNRSSHRKPRSAWPCCRWLFRSGRPERVGAPTGSACRAAPICTKPAPDPAAPSAIGSAVVSSAVASADAVSAGLACHSSAAAAATCGAAADVPKKFGYLRVVLALRDRGRVQTLRIPRWIRIGTVPPAESPGTYRLRRRVRPGSACPGSEVSQASRPCCRTGWDRRHRRNTVRALPARYRIPASGSTSRRPRRPRPVAFG